MSIFVPQASEVNLLHLLSHGTANADLVLHFYVNNHTPADADTVSDYTEMSTWGYSSFTLTGASWTFTAGEPSHMDYAEQVFTSSGSAASVTVYGIYVTGPSGVLEWVEAFATGFVVNTSGQVIGYTPYFSLDMISS